MRVNISKEQLLRLLSYIFTFFLGTTMSMSDSAYLDMHGILIRPKKSWIKYFDKLDRHRPVFIFDTKKSCLISKEAISLFESGEFLYLHFGTSEEQLRILEVLFKTRTWRPVETMTKVCSYKGQVSYGG